MADMMTNCRARWLTRVAVVAAALLVAAQAVLATQGALDPSFGTGGFAQTELDGPLLVQPDGRIVVSGSDPGGMRVSRWLASGALDVSFGTDGSTLIGLGPQDYVKTYRLLGQSTGAVVVVGLHGRWFEWKRIVLARLTADGLADVSFGTGGTSTLDLRPDTVIGGSTFLGAGLQPDDAIVSSDGEFDLVWRKPPCGGTWQYLRRFSSNGSLDSSFPAEWLGCPCGTTVAVQVDRAGRAMGAGAMGACGGGGGLLLLRRTLDGRADVSWGNAGYVKLWLPGTDGWRSLTFPADGSVAAVGMQDGNPIVGHFFQDGTLDPAFGSGGIATITTSDQVDPGAILAQADGAFVVVGTGMRNGNTPGLFLVRVLPNGVVDRAFGSDGVVFVRGSSRQTPYAALQPDGKILVAADGKLYRFIGLEPCVGFGDVDPGSPFCRNVEWMANRLITVGCAANAYCPFDRVTRLAAAAFLNRLGNVLTSAPLAVEQTAPAALDEPIVACSVTAPPAFHPRSATVDAVVSATAAGEVTLSVAPVMSGDEGKTWIPLVGSAPLISVAAGRWSSVRVQAHDDVDAQAPATYGVRLDRVGSGSPSLADSRCVLRVLLRSRDGITPPYD